MDTELTRPAEPTGPAGPARTSAGPALGLRAGDAVEVLTQAEILATLDERGELDSLPFMPEMLAMCGRRFRVLKRADKLCDTINATGMFRMRDAVHLEGARCDGQAHGGCQAACTLYWKEAWLRPVDTTAEPGDDTAADAGGDAAPAAAPASHSGPPVVCTVETLLAATRRNSATSNGSHGPSNGSSEPNGSGSPRYACQTTELGRAAGARVPPWDARQYVDDVRSGNVGLIDTVRRFLVAVFNEYQDVSRRLLPARLRIREGRRYPFIEGRLRKTPAASLDLQPGELVRIRSKEEIVRTLDVGNRNRGLTFDPEMIPYCGREARVLGRVEKILDEKTGEMMHFSNTCIVLEDVICPGAYHRNCPRSTFPYWREIWLDRIT